MDTQSGEPSDPVAQTQMGYAYSKGLGVLVDLGECKQFFGALVGKTGASDNLAWSNLNREKPGWMQQSRMPKPRSNWFLISTTLETF